MRYEADDAVRLAPVKEDNNAMRKIDRRYAVVSKFGDYNRRLLYLRFQVDSTIRIGEQKNFMEVAMDKFIKNVDFEKIFTFENEVEYQQGQIVSKTLAQNKALSLTLFAFDKGEEISSHHSDGDAMVTVIDGMGEITIEGIKYMLNQGETIVMPAGKPHAVYAAERFKMFLIVVFPQNK